MTTTTRHMGIYPLPRATARPLGGSGGGGGGVENIMYIQGTRVAVRGWLLRRHMVPGRAVVGRSSRAI